MAEPITLAHLRVHTKRINHMRGKPQETWTCDTSGKRISSVGTMYISRAYTGYNLIEICSEGGGQHEPLHCGHIPARLLHPRIQGFISGYEYACQDILPVVKQLCPTDMIPGHVVQHLGPDSLPVYQQLRQILKRCGYCA